MLSARNFITSLELMLPLKSLGNYCLAAHGVLRARTL